MKIDVFSSQLFITITPKMRARDNRHVFHFLVPAAKQKHTPVKRHNSAGDMLISNHPSQTEHPVAERAQRPKSEGHAYSRHVLGKRTSGYGVSHAYSRHVVNKSTSNYGQVMPTVDTSSADVPPAVG